VSALEWQLVFSRAAKLFLVLLMLLLSPVLGPGGRVEASFALGQCTEEPDRGKCSFGFELERVLNGEEGVEDAAGPSVARRDNEAPCVKELNRPQGPRDPGESLMGQRLAQPGGASPGSGPSAGQGWGTGGLLLLAPGIREREEGTALLFLADDRFKLPPFATRLFRPPRSCRSWQT
jgi:hypothetical protein